MVWIRFSRYFHANAYKFFKYKLRHGLIFLYHRYCLIICTVVNKYLKWLHFRVGYRRPATIQASPVLLKKLDSIPDRHHKNGYCSNILYSTLCSYCFEWICKDRFEVAVCINLWLRFNLMQICPNIEWKVYSNNAKHNITNKQVKS